jgi:hypothetical protein
MEQPYFIWDYDISEEKIWEILRGDDEFYKTWLVGRILQYARWNDIWKYLTLDDVRTHFDRIAWRFPFIREMWAHALEVWSQGAEMPMLREHPTAYAYVPDREPQLIEGVLTPLQQDSLAVFFADPIARRFWLTGGTALAAFYLGHRPSDDLDLFTLDTESLDEVRRVMPNIAKESKCELTSGLGTQYYQQFLFTRPGLPPLKLDLVRDFGPQFGQRRTVSGVIVDSLTNIAVNKVTTIFGRTEAKDFVDLYCLLRAGYDLKALIGLAQQKDLGLAEFYLGYSMRQVARFKALPKMFEPISLEELRAFYLRLADDLLRQVNPATRPSPLAPSSPPASPGSPSDQS